MYGRTPRRLRAALAFVAAVAFAGSFLGATTDFQQFDFSWGASVVDEGVAVSR
ncbi:hypothetical protein O7631_01695 [Micromonospora sp. WMMD967]|uniref:hypothetical protein n=1 Tax=Micromonospora sp. WMMD967 TaxID=3016101 RepID=UPI0024163D2C|nr:hypothetical protein [Micromonospora sp. WMMD967]MDG4835228.1 hypothetical protein [Micromonospora sp. WMMD967]